MARPQCDAPLVLSIYPESMVLSHVYLCALMFLIWKDTSWTKLHMKRHMVRFFFSKMPLVVALSSLLGGGGDKNSSTHVVIFVVKLSKGKEPTSPTITNP